MQELPLEIKNIIKSYVIFKPKSKKELLMVVNLWCINKNICLGIYVKKIDLYL